MRILITNDDGIESEGIHALVRALATTGHDLVVVAPDRNWSGAGAALGDLSPDRALQVQRVEIPGAEQVPAWALDGPPALTVIAGRLGAFGDPPDLVVSGINAGLNTGRTVLHSGTVGAVLAAQNFGIGGLAVSVDGSDPWWWETAADLAVEVLPLLVAAPPRSALNLNVPALPRGEVRGVRWSRLAPFGAVRAVVGERRDSEVEFTLEATGYAPAADTDQGAVDRGYAAITTLAGVVEAWPLEASADVDVANEVHGDDRERDSVDIASVGTRLVPGAELHAVHRVPDATDHRLLRRPELGA